MSDENKALLQRWFEEVWNNGKAEAIGELASDDLVIHGLTDANGAPISNMQAFRSFHQQFRGAFPDISVIVEDTIAEGDKVVARCSVRGKHTGDSLGFAPTHTDTDFTGIAIARISNGKIVEAWNNFDFLRMNKQLGLL